MAWSVLDEALGRYRSIEDLGEAGGVDTSGIAEEELVRLWEERR